MGIKGIEMSKSYSGVYIKTVFARNEMSRGQVIPCREDRFPVVSSTIIHCHAIQQTESERNVAA